MTDKKTLKSQMIAMRNELENKNKKSQVICQKILDSDVFLKAKNVFIFLSFGSEVDTNIIVESCFANGKKVSVPVCKQDGVMDAVYINGFNDMACNRFGIKEPIDVTKIADKQDIDLIIAPGSVFDKNLNRIGYGKGFYDRFLKKLTHNPIKICIVPSDLVVENSYCNEFDEKINIIVCNNNIFKV